MEPIIAYSAYWHAESNKGRIYLKFPEPAEGTHIEVDSPAELAALIDLLRTNAQMVYDTERKLLSTTWLKPGAR